MRDSGRTRGSGLGAFGIFGDRGAAAVEAAFLVPLFLIPLVVGTLEFGRVLWIKSQLTNAAREGGYFAQYSPTKVAVSNPQCPAGRNITDRALAGLRQGGTLKAVQASAINVYVYRVNLDGTLGTAITGCETSTVASGSRVLVRVEGTVTPLTRLLIPISGYTLAGTQEVRVL